VLAAIIIIAVLGVGLPAVGWLGIRWRTSGGRDPDHDALDRWLTTEYGLTWSERSQVRKAVLGLQSHDLEPVKPEQLRPGLYRPARALARRVLAGEVPVPRVPRPLGWILLLLAVAYTAFGVVILASGHGKSQAQGVINTIWGGADIAVVVATVLLAPRRARRRAERVLAVTGDADPARPHPRRVAGRVAEPPCSP
jgi:hypothetical protein